MCVEKANWCDYTPGFFPDNVASAAYPNASTVVFHLKTPLNPTWFLYNELSQIIPMPIAWDRTSSSGATPTPGTANLPDTTPAGVAKVYKYLTTAGDKYGQLCHQPALDGRGRPVEAAELHQHRGGHLRAQPGLQRLAQADAVQVRRSALHIGRGQPQRDQVRWPERPVDGRTA